MESDNSTNVLPCKSRRRRFFFLPRFTLRFLLIVGFVSCLLFGWVARNLYRVRQEQAAVEALQQAGGSYQTSLDFAARNERALDGYDPLARLLGRTKRPEIRRVGLKSANPDDPKADAAIAALKTFPEIEMILLQGQAFDDASVARLAELQRLGHVALIYTNVGDAGLASLRRTKVRSVLHQGGNASTELVKTAASLPELKSLALAESKPVEPLSYAALEQATRLKRLVVISSGFDDEDAAAVAKLENMEWLTVDGITDAGLERLAPLKKLTQIDLFYPVTEAAAREFSALHPACRVEYDGQAYLAGELIP